MIVESGQRDAEAISVCDRVEGSVCAAASAFRIEVGRRRPDIQSHRHRQGQLAIALRGAITCIVPDGMLVVPPRCGVWVPGGVVHRNEITPNAKLAYLFVEPGTAGMPEDCCIIAISPLVRELILDLADASEDGPRPIHRSGLLDLLLGDLASMPRDGLRLPMSEHPKITAIAEAMLASPGNRRTIGGWASMVAMSERSLKRLIERETGLSFGHWRRQLHLMIAVRELAAGITVQRIASTLGYQSTTAFIVMFRKAFDCTPKRYLEERLRADR